MSAAIQSDWAARYSRNKDLAKAHVTNLVAETFEQLGLQLPPKARKALPEKLLACLECGSTRVHVKRGNRRFQVAAAAVVDDIEKYSNGEIELLDGQEINEYIEPLLFFPDMIWLNKSLSLLRKAGEAAGFDWNIVDEILRDQVGLIPTQRFGEKRSRTREHPNGSTSVVRRRERSPEIAKRRTIIENILSSKPRASAQEICKGLDSHSNPVPDPWAIEGNMTWLSTLMKHPNKVHKLISVERSKVLKS